MEAQLIIAAASFALVASITPGPNNLLLAASGLTFGMRRTLPLLLGIEFGFQLLLLCVALGLGVVFERVPMLHPVLKIAGAAYLLHLAWNLWRSSSAAGAVLAKPLGFLRGAAFQFVNPKAWMMTIGAVSAYTLGGNWYWTSVAMVVGVFFVMGVPSITLWAACGAAFRSALADPTRARLVGRAMAVLTALSCLLIFI